MENLQQQQQEIDTPDTPDVEPINVDIDELRNSFSGTIPYVSPKTQEASKRVSAGMAPQIQGEFANWDPDLDKGIISGQDQNEVRAENQGFWGETGAGLFQMANEVTLGTLEATALMADLDMHAKAIAGTEQEFSSSLSRTLGDLKDELNAKYGKVYVAEENKGFSPGSWEFWASNGGNVATALTLMIPSMAAVKGLSALAKLSKISRLARMSNSAKAATKGIASAIISRFGENAMEASEAVEATKADFYNLDGSVKLNPATKSPYTEEEIKKTAGKAGVNTWRYNWPMLVLDMVQYSKAFRGIDYARRTAEHSVKKSLASQVGGFIIKDMGGEGAEEGYQYIVSQESQYSAKSKAGLLEGKDEFWSRLSDYVTDDEFKTSVLLGAMGGAVFSGAGAINSYRDTRLQFAERIRLEDLHRQNDAAITKNVEKFTQAEDIGVVSTAVSKAVSGDIDQMEADLEDLYNEPDSELELQGVKPEEYREKITRAKKLVADVASEYNKVMNESLPKDLISSTLYSRIDRKMSELHKVDIAKTREAVLTEDKKIFEAKEPATADMMIKLKTLLLNKNNEKAEALAETIAETSNLYKDKKDVFNALNTSSDVELKRLSTLDNIVTERIKASEEYERKIKTEEGRAEILNVVKKEQDKKQKEKTKKEANKKATEEANNEEIVEETEEGTIDSKSTPEQLAYIKERNKRVKELQDKGVEEYDAGIPDGGKVFSTFNKDHKRTWVKGEIVKDSKGNKYRVLGPTAKPYAARLMPIDKNGNNKKGEEPVLSYKVEGLSFESLKPGRKDVETEWSINKFRYDNVVKREVENKKEESVTEQILQGVIKTTNSEFSNYKPNSKGRWAFEEDPKADTTSWFPIDFDKAASPMTVGETQEVDLVVENYGGVNVIVVKQDGKAISKMSEKDRKGQHSKLVEFIQGKGGSIKATLKDKYVSFTNNLGTIPNSKTSLSAFDGSEFLPKGKIFIGSRKKQDSEMRFTSSDGEFIDIPVSEKQAESMRTGNTYVLLLSPSGDMVPIQLNESRLSEVTTSDGISYAEDTLSKLEEAATVLQGRLEALVHTYMTEGTASGAIISTREQAVERAKKVLGLAKSDEVRAEKSETQEALDSIIGPVTRLIEGQRVTDSEGNIVKKDGYELRKTTGNYFNVAFKYSNETGKVEVRVTDALPNPDKGSTSEFLKSHAKDRNEQIEKLGDRFFTTSLDIMNSPEGGKYVEKIISEDWVTTDLYANRPWVNPRLTIQLDNEATMYTSEGIKPVTPKRKTAPKTKKEVAVDTTSETINDDSIKLANKSILKITDVLTPEELAKKKTKNEIYTVEDYVEEHLKGKISVAEFNNLAGEIVKDIRSKETGPDKMRHQAVWRQAYKTVTKEIMESSTEEVEVVKNTNTIDSILNDEKSTKEKEIVEVEEIQEEKPKSIFKSPKKQTSPTSTSKQSETNSKGKTTSKPMNGSALDSLLSDIETANDSLSLEAIDKARKATKSGKIQVNCKK